MAILGTSYWNIIDVLKAGGDGIGDVVEALTQLTPFMQDANVITCNKGTKHASSIRTGLPSVSWGALYQGIKQSKGNYTQVEDTTGFIEGLSAVDTRLLKLKPDQAAKLRLMEGQGFLEIMAQTLASAVWYSNTFINGKQFHGLAPRYNSLANPNVINGGGTGATMPRSGWSLTVTARLPCSRPKTCRLVCSVKTRASSAFSMRTAIPTTSRKRCSRSTPVSP
nr:hypothetical protein [Novosphingobium sp. ST904]